MSEIETEELSLSDIYNLSLKVFTKNGCNENNATALSKIVHDAERDGSLSHGLFRIPGYVASLRSGKVKGDAEPVIDNNLPSVISVDGNYGFAPYALEKGLPYLSNSAEQLGIAIMKITNTFHFAALWPETEFLANKGLVGIACTAAKPMVAPAGAQKAFFGTNPISFAWPRIGEPPIVFDMATSRLAMGDVQIAARDGHQLPDGTGLGPNGEPTNNPKDVIKGVLLPFGGYKGSAISLMVELLSAGLTGDNFSYEAGEKDNNDGGPPKGGELVIAISPKLVAGNNWEKHTLDFIKKLKELEGIRIPGERRHKNRLNTGLRKINKEMLQKVKNLL